MRTLAKAYLLIVEEHLLPILWEKGLITVATERWLRLVVGQWARINSPKCEGCRALRRRYGNEYLRCSAHRF